jgi:predicted HTH domain antitoxin
MADTLTLLVTLPREIVALLGAPSRASETAREYVILGLVQEARISGGKAAQLLGLTRAGFVALVTRKGIPQIRLEPEEWDAEVARLRAS